MDLFSLGFLLLILVASGFVAFLADRLGKKLGKKRLSIWGLRPKHVAAIGTVVMGVLVSALTIALVAAASKDARTWLREGRQLLVQRERLTLTNDNLKSQIARLNGETESLTKAKQALQGTNSSLKQANGALQKGLNEERLNLSKAIAQRKLLETEAAQLEREIRSLGREVASLSSTLSSTRLALANSQATLTENRTTLGKVRTNLASVQSQIRAAKKELVTSGINLTDARSKLNAALKQGLETYKEVLRLQGEVTKGEERVAELETQRVDAEKKLAAAQVQYATTQARLDDAGRDLVQLQQIAESQGIFLNDTFKTSRTEAMTFRAGEEVARVLVPGGADAQMARSSLTTLIRSARVTAAGRGAKGHRTDGQTFEVADIFDRSDRKTGSAVTAETLKRAVVDRVAGRVEDQVLVATSSLNAFTGEVVSLDIAVLPNPMVYRRDDPLSEARIDGTLTEDRIFAQISEFVRSRVTERAVQDQMIPRAKTDAPFGEIPTLDIFNLVRDVKKAGRTVRVQAVAAEDIRAADPLRLEFRLK